MSLTEQKTLYFLLSDIRTAVTKTVLIEGEFHRELLRLGAEIINSTKFTNLVHSRRFLRQGYVVLELLRNGDRVLDQRVSHNTVFFLGQGLS
jgi:hypothetical protein